MIPQSKIQANFNNDFASAISQGDPRLQMKQMDRGGMSRGAGQMSNAGMQGAQKMADGIAQAYSNRQTAQDYNNAFSMQNQQSDATQQQALQGLLQQQQYNNQLAAQQRQNSALNFATSLLGGLLN
jgi:hypothetical protein